VGIVISGQIYQCDQRVADLVASLRRSVLVHAELLDKCASLVSEVPGIVPCMCHDDCECINGDAYVLNAEINKVLFPRRYDRADMYGCTCRNYSLIVAGQVVNHCENCGGVYPNV